MFGWAVRWFLRRKGTADSLVPSRWNLGGVRLSCRMVRVEGIEVDLGVGSHLGRKGRGKKDGAPLAGFVLHPRSGGSASLRLAGRAKRPSPHESCGRRSMRRLVALLVSSLMVQSISLWGCAVLAGGVGNPFQSTLSPNRHRGSRLGRFAGAGGEPLAYS